MSWSDHEITAEEYLRTVYPNMMSFEEATKILNERGYIYLNEILGERVNERVNPIFDFKNFIRD